VFFHEIPHEIGDYGILIRNGLTHSQAIKVQILTAIASIIGCICGIVLDSFHLDDISISTWVLPITAGGFIYISLVDVVADLIKTEPSLIDTILQMICLCAGVGMMVVVSLLEE